MKRSPLLTSAAALSAVGFSAAAGALVRRMLRHGAVNRAVRVSSKDADTGQLPVLASDRDGIPPITPSGWQGDRPVTPVPSDAVTATVSATVTEETGDKSVVDDDEPLPARTWVVENSSEWDGSPLEMVVPPGKQPRKGEPGAAPLKGS